MEISIGNNLNIVIEEGYSRLAADESPAPDLGAYLTIRDHRGTSGRPFAIHAAVIHRLALPGLSRPVSVGVKVRLANNGLRCSALGGWDQAARARCSQVW